MFRIRVTRSKDVVDECKEKEKGQASDLSVYDKAIKDEDRRDRQEYDRAIRLSQKRISSGNIDEDKLINNSGAFYAGLIEKMLDVCVTLDLDNVKRKIDSGEIGDLSLEDIKFLSNVKRLNELDAILERTRSLDTAIEILKSGL
jgi:hypothetical protein